MSVISCMQCPKCMDRGNDNLRRFSDGGQKCFACGYYIHPKDSRSSYSGGYTVNNPSHIRNNDSNDFITIGEYKDIIERNLSETTCRAYGCQVADVGKQKVYLFNMKDADGNVVSQKIRWVGNKKKKCTWQVSSEDGKELYGEHLAQDFTKPIVITEGELDAMSIYEAFNGNVQAVSIIHGSSSADKDLAARLNYLEKFPKIILWFDSDEPGTKAFTESVKILPLGKVYCPLLQNNFKDANEYLLHAQPDLICEAIQYAKEYVPEAIQKPTIEQLLEVDPFGWEIPWPILNQALRGVKKGRLITILAGSKIGKTSFTKELIKHIIDNNADVVAGFLYLEEPIKTTGQSFIALDNNIPLYQFQENPSAISKEKFEASYAKYVASNRVHYLNASFENLDSKRLFSYLTYMITVLKCNILLLDHITMVTYDMEGENSERKDIDKLMKDLRALINKHNVTVLAVCHLKRPSRGQSYAEGRPVDMSDARGSAAIEQLSDYILGLERNLKDPLRKDKIKISVCGNRLTGESGYMDELYYISTTGRLT